MTIVRVRPISIGGGLAWVDLEWDSPMIVENEDGSLSQLDPDATWKVHSIFYRNVMVRAVFELRLRHRVTDLVRIMGPGTQETEWKLGVGQRPDLRDTTALVVDQSVSENPLLLQSPMRGRSDRITRIEVPLNSMLGLMR